MSIFISIAIGIRLGNSLVGQWLGFGALTTIARVQSLVGELRSHKLCNVASI